MNSGIEIKTLLGRARGAERHLSAGETLFSPDDEARALFLVTRGLVVVSRHDLPIAWAGPGEVAGEAALFDTHHDSRAVALKNTVIEVLPKALVLLHLAAHPAIALDFAARLARRLARCEDMAALLRQNGAVARVEGWLRLEGADRAAYHCPLPLLRVAESLGLSHEAFYRALRALEQSGRLQRAGRRSFRLTFTC